MCCSPSHFEKVSQLKELSPEEQFELFAFAFREGFTASNDTSAEPAGLFAFAFREGFTAGRYESPGDLQLFAFAFREGFTAWFLICRLFTFAVRLRISRRFHSLHICEHAVCNAVRLRISRRFHSEVVDSGGQIMRCSPSHFEKVSQPSSSLPLANLSCSPSHFEKVSQLNRTLLYLSLRLFAFAFREGFTAKYRNKCIIKLAVRLRISRRFHSGNL